MKFYSCLILLLVVGYSQQERFNLADDKNIQECRKIHIFDDKLWEELKSGKFPDVDSLKCFVKCWYDKSDFINDEGKVKIDEMKKFLENVEKGDQIAKELDKCKDRKADTCDAVYDFDKCVLSGMEL